MSDILDDINAIASQRWSKPSVSDLIKQELTRRYDNPAWMGATMGECVLSNGTEIYMALLASSAHDTDLVHVDFLLVEWNGKDWRIHEVINTQIAANDGSEDEA